MSQVTDIDAFVEYNDLDESEPVMFARIHSVSAVICAMRQAPRLNLG